VNTSTGRRFRSFFYFVCIHTKKHTMEAFVVPAAEEAIVLSVVFRDDRLSFDSGVHDVPVVPSVRRK
jgi:hypothetical protein